MSKKRKPRKPRSKISSPKPRSKISSPEGLENIATPREDDEKRRGSNSPRNRRALNDTEFEDEKSGVSSSRQGPSYFEPERADFAKLYQYVRYLGSGSYGDVCEAVSLENKNKRVAIKKVRNIFKNIADAKRLLRELRILRTLRNHPAIISLLDIIPPKDVSKFQNLSIVLEFVETDLRQCILSDQHFTTRHVQHLLLQLLLGLKFIHTANIVHRDIKPANILVNGDCSLKICDFGLARCMTENFAKVKKRTSRLRTQKKHEEVNTETSRPRSKKKHEDITKYVVTRWYRAPEIILLQQQRNHVAAIDMWAVGCVLGELLEMIKGNCHDFSNRSPLFPGTTAWPFSFEHPSAWKSDKDQLNVIFDKIGTPSKREILLMTNDETRKYLQKLPTRNPINWRKKFPASGIKVLDLLCKLLRFNFRKRLTVNQALSHSFLRDVRRREHEMESKKLKFEFEDIKIDLPTLQWLIIEEIIYWNVSLSSKLKRDFRRTKNKRVTVLSKSVV